MVATASHKLHVEAYGRAWDFNMDIKDKVHSTLSCSQAVQVTNLKTWLRQ